MVDFAGWEMPVQYAGVIDEHRAVRTAAGLFDVSHMGEVRVRGAGAEAFLTAKIRSMERKLVEEQGHAALGAATGPKKLPSPRMT